MSLEQTFFFNVDNTAANYTNYKNGTQFWCPFCPESFSTQKVFEKHMWNCHFDKSESKSIRFDTILVNNRLNFFCVVRQHRDALKMSCCGFFCTDARDYVHHFLDHLFEYSQSQILRFIFVVESTDENQCLTIREMDLLQALQK